MRTARRADLKLDAWFKRRAVTSRYGAVWHALLVVLTIWMPV